MNEGFLSLHLKQKIQARPLVSFLFVFGTLEHVCVTRRVEVHVGVIQGSFCHFNFEPIDGSSVLHYPYRSHGKGVPN